MTAQEVGEVVCKAFDDFIQIEPSTTKWDALRERLVIWLRSVDEPLAFEGMLWVFEYRDRYQHQQLAGELLRRCGIRLLIPLETFICRVAPRLNASASEVARYLREQTGDDAALRQIESLGRSATDPRLCTGLQALRYWHGTKGSASDPAENGP